MYNTKESYGWVAIILHWLMAIAIVGMFGLGWYMVDLTYYDSLYKTLPFIHKSIGIILIVVFLFRLYWRLSSPVPDAIEGSSPMERKVSKLVHRIFYWLLPLIMISGYLISTADGSKARIGSTARTAAIRSAKWTTQRAVWAGRGSRWSFASRITARVPSLPTKSWAGFHASPRKRSRG